MTAGGAERKPFFEHLLELRRRLMWSLAAVAVGAVIGYQFHQQLIEILLHPYDAQLFYSSLTGGLDFIIRICLFFGIVVAIPVATYNLLRFLEPVMARQPRLMVVKLLSASVMLASAGILFAYFLSLPAAIHFLLEFGNEHIQPLISTDQYFNFVMLYLAGFAIIFQLPLVLGFINWITPLRPGGLMKQQRVVIAASFIAAAIVTPTPDAVNMTLMAAPIIALYQLSILMIWLYNRTRNPPLESVVPVASIAPVRPEAATPPRPKPVTRSIRPNTEAMPTAPLRRYAAVLDLTGLQPPPEVRFSPNLLDLRTPRYPGN